MKDFMETIFTTMILWALPTILLFFLIWNLVSFIKTCVLKTDKPKTRVLELMGIVVGFGYHLVLMGLTMDQNIDTIPVVIWIYLCFFLLSFVGYGLARWVPTGKQASWIWHLSLGAMWIGILTTLVWCVQNIQDYSYWIYPINVVMVYIKVMLLHGWQQRSIEEN